MKRKFGWFLLQLLLIPFPAIFLLQIFFIFVNALNLPALSADSDSVWRLFLPLPGELSSKIVFLLFTGWLVALIYLEIYAAFGARFPYRRTLVNLRFGPPMSFFFAMVFVFVFDAGMIEYSKYRIRQYVGDASERVAEPDFYPHSDYRGWCGNGITERESELYFATAAAGIDDPRPTVRARSFLMTQRVRDFFNGGDLDAYRRVLEKNLQRFGGARAFAGDPGRRFRLP
ncbi:MAG: hypothetical protein JSS81_21720 [Acidobacteria bacterium]|nr:hypothetical protein [Acidobacteriota bacterium]